MRVMMSGRWAESWPFESQGVVLVPACLLLVTPPKSYKAARVQDLFLEAHWTFAFLSPAVLQEHIACHLLLGRSAVTFRAGSINKACHRAPSLSLPADLFLCFAVPCSVTGQIWESGNVRTIYRMFGVCVLCQQSLHRLHSVSGMELERED